MTENGNKRAFLYSNIYIIKGYNLPGYIFPVFFKSSFIFVP